MCTLMLKVVFAPLLLVILAPLCFTEVIEDDVLSENNRDPPSFKTFMRQTYKAVSEMAFDNEKYPYDHAYTMMLFSEGSPTVRQVGATLLLALAYTLLRYFSQPQLRRLAIWLKFRPEDVEKVPEGVFRSTYYCFITAYGAYISFFSGRYNFIQQPCEVYNQSVTMENYYQQEMPSDLLSLYWIQSSYYLSGIYFELYMDQRRKDTVLMLIHHFVTLSLIYFSFMARYLKHGCLLFFLIDISDAILETGKIYLYFNNRGGITRKRGEIFSNIVFFSFTVTWFYFRIYLFCVRLLHSTNWCFYIQRHIWLPRLYVFFNVLLLMLFVTQLIWSYYILVMCVRLITGQDKYIKDIRDRKLCKNVSKPHPDGSSTVKRND